jgi:hypothetical protein
MYSLLYVDQQLINSKSLHRKKTKDCPALQDFFFLYIAFLIIGYHLQPVERTSDLLKQQPFVECTKAFLQKLIVL